MVTMVTFLKTILYLYFLFKIYLNNTKYCEDRLRLLVVTKW